MKLIIPEFPNNDLDTSAPEVYFTNPTSFVLSRTEAGVRYHYAGRIESDGGVDNISLVERTTNTDGSIYEFSMPHIDYNEDDNQLLEASLIANFITIKPITEQAIERKVPDTLKYALRAIAVLIALSAGNCVRKQYLIDQRIEAERTQLQNNH